ncbi:MAG: adenine phosphoribosyltransferase [Cellvibrionaceae bacterium]|nr:adenine phosphoribosyltransferase [Cellvibrionaceae bacterium]MAZ90314.1 adenine phosphoribosyltransferase [Cellvibrionaceae bacterium]|tara:strand:+ start:17074 stop:17613 length:540 start_codon:yes stop_codon:yes gene_type:complete
MVFDEFLIRSHIPTVENWPQEGVSFRDITPLFQNPATARMITDSLAWRYLNQDITHIAALDARGFLLGSNLAYALNKPLVLIRKPGKLPGEVDRVSYDSEYAKGELELQKSAFSVGDKVVIVDDLIATGGTLLAASRLIRNQGAEINEVAAIVDLINLKGSERLTESSIPCFSLISFDD